MNSPRWKQPFRIAAVVLTGIILSGAMGCKKSSVAGKISPADAKQQRLAWNLETTVEAYNKFGDANGAWNEPARAALTEFSRLRARVIADGEPADEIIKTNCEAAIAAGCHDPLIDYLNVRFVLSMRMRGTELADKYCDAAIALKDSGYPAVRKFYGARWAVQQVYSAYGNKADPQTIHEAGGDLKDLLMQLLDDKTMPVIEMYEACNEGLIAYEGDGTQYEAVYREAEKKIFENWPGESQTWLLKGQGYIQLAWNARGSGYATSVSKDGWKLYGERLTVAEDALNRAWLLNSNDVNIPSQFLTLELGQGEGRERMELWFQRAMKLDPANYSAAWQKLYYLEPKWYGSAEDMIEFGRECVSNTEWQGRMPLVLVDAHARAANYLDKSEQAAYWKRPEVWPDIKSAFDRFFELNPDAVSWYHNYVWYAYHCEQWNALNELLPKLGPVNYDYFGGPDEYDKMVRLAKEHAKK